MGQHSPPPVMSSNTNSNTRARDLTSTLQLAQLTERSLQPTVCSGLDPNTTFPCLGVVEKERPGSLRSFEGPNLNLMLRNPGTAMSIYQIAECPGEAHRKAMTHSNIKVLCSQPEGYMSKWSTKAKKATSSSILKSPGVLRRVPSLAPVQRVRFHLPTQLESIFNNFINRSDTKPYEELICALKDSEVHELQELAQNPSPESDSEEDKPSRTFTTKSMATAFHRIQGLQMLADEDPDVECSDDDLQPLLQEARKCISLVDESLHHFVRALLRVPWVKRSPKLVELYQGLLVDLVSAHNYYTVGVLDSLVLQFTNAFGDKEWEDNDPPEAEKQYYQHVHKALCVLLQVVPMSRELLLQSIVSRFPYLKVDSHIQECFLYNLFQIIDYEPALSQDLYTLIINRLVALDVNAPRSVLELSQDRDMFDMEDVLAERSLAHTLDTLLAMMFRYLRSQCLDWDGIKSTYILMLHTFEHVILPTHATCHVQFLMFYLCSFKPVLGEAFLNALWRKVTSPHVPPVIRQAAASVLKFTLAEMAAWIHKYIQSQDSLECANSDIRVHTVFYSVCQALFYVVAFRHGDLVQSKKDLTFMQSLNMAQIVTCRLNPLRVCLPVVVRNFAAVTRTYQLAYCYTIIEHNSRNSMPIIHTDDKGVAIARSTVSGKDISPLYREYEQTDMDDDHVEAEERQHQGKNQDEEDDDFLCETTGGSESSQNMFTYSISPGFKSRH
uniref:RNA polymerase I-specific transcription initiation factor RRN3 n=1 Tax=Timema poppense TaxID=170557 RepID=A0A7R9GXG1_TIMPO|nr:unnamed protein product [Timema poppensis]